VILLYEHPASPYAQKVKIALAEKNIPFETRVPGGLGSGIISNPDFLEGNPRREVPLLVDDGNRIFDSTIILEYIEDKWPNPGLLPHGPADRARVRMVEDIMDTQYEAMNWVILEIKVFNRATGVAAQQLLDRVADQAAKLHIWLERQLGTRSWFNGANFGWGDMSVVPHLNVSADHGLPPRSARLRDWLNRANERTSVMQCAGAARRAMAASPDLSRLVASGLFRRQYRDHRLEAMLRSGGWFIVRDGLDQNTIRFAEELRDN
jgi:glutathione S-transferase